MSNWDQMPSFCGVGWNNIIQSVKESKEWRTKDFQCKNMSWLPSETQLLGFRAPNSNSCRFSRTATCLRDALFPFSKGCGRVSCQMTSNTVVHWWKTPFRRTKRWGDSARCPQFLSIFCMPVKGFCLDPLLGHHAQVAAPCLWCPTETNSNSLLSLSWAVVSRDGWNQSNPVIWNGLLLLGSDGNKSEGERAPRPLPFRWVEFLVSNERQPHHHPTEIRCTVSCPREWLI